MTSRIYACAPGDENVYSRPGIGDGPQTGWTHHPGITADQIQCCGEHIYVRGPDRKITYMGPCSDGDWVDMGNSPCDHFHVNARNAEHLWACEGGKYYYRPGFEVEGAGCGWQDVEGDAMRVSISGKGKHIYGIDGDNNLYHKKKIDGEWVDMNSKACDVAVGGRKGQHIYAIDPDNRLWYRKGWQGVGAGDPTSSDDYSDEDEAGWIDLGSDAIQVAVSACGEHVFAISPDNRLFYRPGLGDYESGWEDMDSDAIWVACTNE